MGVMILVALKMERRVYMWHVLPCVIPKAANKFVSLEDIIEIMSQSYQNNTSNIYYSEEGIIQKEEEIFQEDPKNRVYISHIKNEEKYFTMLINRGDPNVADTAFIDLTSNSVRSISPEDGETQGWSAHLVIAKNSSSGYHRACVERMPRATGSSILALLDRIMDRHSKMDMKYRYEKKKKIKGKIVTEIKRCKPSLNIARVPSENIMNDLKNGTLSGITLIKNKAEFSGLDLNNIIKSSSERLVLRTKDVNPTTLKSFIKTMTPWARGKGYDEIKIDLADLPGGSSASPTFKLDEEDATEVLYVRSQRITGFPILLASCYKDISEEIKDKLIELIEDNEKW